MNLYEEKRLKREKWVSTLQVGDKVAIRSGSYGFRMWRVHTVEKVTPSGRRNLSQGFVAMPDGSLRGDKYSYIYPITDDIVRSIKRVQTQQKLSRIKVELLSDDHLNRLISIIDEHEKDPNSNK